MVEGLSSETLPASSVTEAPCDHSCQWQNELPSLGALPNVKPAGVLLVFSAWQSLRKPSVSVGKRSNPAAFTSDMGWTGKTPITTGEIPIHRPLLLPYCSISGSQPPAFDPA